MKSRPSPIVSSADGHLDRAQDLDETEASQRSASVVRPHAGGTSSRPGCAPVPVEAFRDIPEASRGDGGQARDRAPRGTHGERQRGDRSSGRESGRCQLRRRAGGAVSDGGGLSILRAIVVA